MKKRLLLMGIAMLSVASSFAYEVGDYIYTRNGRFKVTGANLITNGDFQQGLEGWMKADLTAFEEGQTWYQLGVNEGPDGKNSLTVVEAVAKNFQSSWVNQKESMAASTNLFRYVPVQANQNYVVTYKARMTDETSQATAICPYNGRSTNYQAFYFKPAVVDTMGTAADPNTFYDVPGSKTTISNASEVINGDWQEISYSYTSTEEGFICLFFGNLVASESFADFGVYAVDEVSDDRGVKDALEQVQFYIDNKELFPNDQETIEGVKEMLQGYLTNEDKNEVDGLLKGFNTNDETLDPFMAFLNANSVDLAQDKYMKNFYNGGTGWSNTGGNWGTAAAKGNFNTQYVNQYGKAASTLGAGDYYQTMDLPAGKYLFVAQAQAYKFIADGSGGSSNYEIPRYEQVTGMRAFVGNDSINMDDVPTTRGKVYMKLLNVEAGVKNIGFHSPGGTANMGGDYRFDGLQIRYIGTQDDLDAYVWQAKVIEKLDKFQQGINAAQAVCDSTDFVFAKSKLVGAIEWAKNMHQTLTAYTEENYNELIVAHDSIDKARREYVSINKEFTQLKRAIELASSKITEDRTKSLETLNGVITAANQYVAAQTEDSRDSLTLVTTTDKVLKAGEEYLIANASYATPADLFYSLKNNSFQSKNSNGWEQDGKTGNDRWKFGEDASFTEKFRIVYSRGNSANDEKYVYQTVENMPVGKYVFAAEVAVHNSTWSSIQPSDCYLYVGADSVEVCTLGPGDKKNTVRGEIARKEVMTVTTEEGNIRVGLHNYTNIKVNILEMGSCHLYYYGPYEKYLADSMAVALKPMKDSLLREVAVAQALYDEARNPNNVDTTPFSTAIATAKGVGESATATFAEVEAQFPALKQATENFVFSGVYPAKGKFYDHSKLLKNTTFDDAEKPFDNWVCDSLAEETKVADSFNNVAGFPGYLWSFHRSASGMKRNANIHQDVTGLSAGTYAFAANVVYRYAWREEWNASEYEQENKWFKMFTNTDTVAVNGFMAEGAKLVDEANTKSNLIYPNGATISVYSTRHHGDANGVPGIIALFESGLFLTQCPFEAADGKATVGLLVEECPDNSAMLAYNLSLRFYGDRDNFEQSSGIEAITTHVERMNNGAIYNLRGQRIANPVRGLYIKNGKKFVIK